MNVPTCRVRRDRRPREGPACPGGAVRAARTVPPPCPAQTCGSVSATARRRAAHASVASFCRSLTDGCTPAPAGTFA
jgi:hypothetical protein